MKKSSSDHTDQSNRQHTNLNLLPTRKIIDLLERELVSGCDDSVLTVGLEPFLQTYARSLKSSDQALRLKSSADRLIQIIQGYTVTDRKTREAKIRELLLLLDGISDQSAK